LRRPAELLGHACKLRHLLLRGELRRLLLLKLLELGLHRHLLLLLGLLRGLLLRLWGRLLKRRRGLLSLRRRSCRRGGRFRAASRESAQQFIYFILRHYAVIRHSTHPPFFSDYSNDPVLYAVTSFHRYGREVKNVDLDH
jgi:hypothetical protein